jgi:hypothetical protein
LIRAGLDPVTVASVLGHEDATVTLSVCGHLYNRQRTDEAFGSRLRSVDTRRDYLPADDPI